MKNPTSFVVKVLTPVMDHATATYTKNTEESFYRATIDDDLSFVHEVLERDARGNHAWKTASGGLRITAISAMVILWLAQPRTSASPAVGRFVVGSTYFIGEIKVNPNHGGPGFDDQILLSEPLTLFHVQG